MFLSPSSTVLTIVVNIVFVSCLGLLELSGWLILTGKNQSFVIHSWDTALSFLSPGSLPFTNNFYATFSHPNIAYFYQNWHMSKSWIKTYNISSVDLVFCIPYSNVQIELMVPSIYIRWFQTPILKYIVSQTAWYSSFFEMQ